MSSGNRDRKRDIKSLKKLVAFPIVQSSIFMTVNNLTRLSITLF